MWTDKHGEKRWLVDWDGRRGDEMSTGPTTDSQVLLTSWAFTSGGAEESEEE